jgi:putative ABC transport system permease protein
MTAETLLLSLMGGALGIAIAQVGLRTILASLPSSFPLPRIEEIQIDTRVLLFTVAVSIAVGMIFGLLPAIQVRRTNLRESLSEAGRGMAGSHKRAWGGAGEPRDCRSASSRHRRRSDATQL